MYRVNNKRKFSISDKEKEDIRNFVRNGGHKEFVLGDVIWLGSYAFTVDYRKNVHIVSMVN